MVGFVAGVIRETQTSETLLQQAAHLSPWTVFWLLLIVVASLQPITRAAKSEPFGRLRWHAMRKLAGTVCTVTHWKVLHVSTLGYYLGLLRMRRLVHTPC